ncbi:MAG: hypothetical protein ABSF92_02025 [Candidatus Acidiferrales bacterium]|jgi:hypothetical protein
MAYPIIVPAGQWRSLPNPRPDDEGFAKLFEREKDKLRLQAIRDGHVQNTRWNYVFEVFGPCVVTEGIVRGGPAFQFEPSGGGERTGKFRIVLRGDDFDLTGPEFSSDLSTLRPPQ